MFATGLEVYTILHSEFRKLNENKYWTISIKCCLTHFPPFIWYRRIPRLVLLNVGKKNQKKTKQAKVAISFWINHIFAIIFICTCNGNRVMKTKKYLLLQTQTRLKEQNPLIIGLLIFTYK